MKNREKFIEKVRTMKNEELAYFIIPDNCLVEKCLARGYCVERGEEYGSDCIEIVCEWLEQEVDDGTGN